MDVVRARRGPAGLGLLRPAGPEGTARLHRARAGRLDGALSNTGDAAVTEDDGGRRWTFPDTPPLSTYNPVVNAGPFHEIRRRARRLRPRALRRRSLAAMLDRDADELFDVTAAGLAFFGEAFGMPFPQTQVRPGVHARVWVARWRTTAASRGPTSCSTGSDPTPAEQELRASVLLHEMAHMWFGNIVTMRWWDDLWLNEAFAEFAANWAAAAATRFADAWAGLPGADKLAGYRADQGAQLAPDPAAGRRRRRRRRRLRRDHLPQGRSGLKQLIAYVGEDDFLAGMRRTSPGTPGATRGSTTWSPSSSRPAVATSPPG